MMKRKPKQKQVRTSPKFRLNKQSNRVLGTAFVIVFAVLGFYFLTSSHAQSPFASGEAESGSLASGASTVSDNNASGGSAIKFGSGASATPGIHVSGNQLVNGSTPIILHGVNRSGSEFACIQGYAIWDNDGGSTAGDTPTNDDLQITNMKKWTGINSLNIPINEDCWLGINGVPAAYGGTNYINAIKHEVATAEANGITPVIALFWTAAGSAQALDHAAMVDNDHGPTLWQSMANTFKSDPNVILRIKEEPYPAGNTDGASAWACWKNGDYQYDTSNTLVPISHNVNCSEGYPALGMQSMINIIRGTGATNVIQVPGVEYANDMNNFLNTTYKVSDPLSPAQLMGVVDTYPAGNGCGSTTCYNNYYAPITAIMPFMAGETAEDPNCSSTATTNIDTFMSWLDSHNSGYMAWTWDTWGGSCQLISSYATGAAKSPWGTDFKSHLLTAPQ